MPFRCVALVVVLGAAGCLVAGTDPPDQPLPPPPGNLQAPAFVRPVDTTVTVGDTLRYATGVHGDATSWNVTWHVSDSLLASVDSAGLVSARAPGVLRVEAILQRSGSSRRAAALLTIAP